MCIRDSSYADDSRLRQAEMYLDLAERLAKDGPKKTCEAEKCPDYEAKFTALLAELPTRYPDGDRRAEALWRLAFRALRKKDLVKAKAWLTSALEKIPREVGWDQEGRTLYWLAQMCIRDRSRSCPQLAQGSDAQTAAPAASEQRRSGRFVVSADGCPRYRRGWRQNE